NAATTWAWPSMPRRCRCSMPPAGARCAPRDTTTVAAPERREVPVPAWEPRMADLRLGGLSKRFGDVQALRELQLEVTSGEFIVLLGPSGAGKTTTLRLVAGLEKPDHGSVHIGGHDVTALAPALRDVTFVFQQYSLYPHLSVFDNLAFPLR